MNKSGLGRGDYGWHPAPELARVVAQALRTMRNILDKGYILDLQQHLCMHGQLNFAQSQYEKCTLKPGMVFLQKVLRNGWHAEYQQCLAWRPPAKACFFV